MIFLKVISLILFLILFILIFVFFTFILFAFSSLEFCRSKLKIDTRRKEKIEENYCFRFSLKLFGIIPWVWININKEKVNKVKESIRFNKLKLKMLKNVFDNKKNIMKLNLFNGFKIVKLLKINLKKLQFNLSFDTEDVNFTSYLTALIGAIVGILIGNIGEKYSLEKYRYIITPTFLNSKFLKLDLNCIFNVKMVHIITVIYLLLKKRSDKKYARTSNRRAYDYSNE